MTTPLRSSGWYKAAREITARSHFFRANASGLLKRLCHVERKQRAGKLRPCTARKCLHCVRLARKWGES